MEVASDTYFNFPCDAPYSHPCCDQHLHVILLVLKLINILDLGHRSLSDLLKDDVDFCDIYSPQIVATSYYILFRFFAEQGRFHPVGSHGKYSYSSCVMTA